MTACLASAELSPTKKISVKHVIKTAVDRFASDKLPEIKNNPQANNLFNKLFKRVVANRRKIFLVSSEKAESDDRLKELLHFRFIHLLAQDFMFLPAEGDPIQYYIYSLDYSKLISMKAYQHGDRFLEIMKNTSRLGSILGGISSIGFVILNDMLNNQEFGGKLRLVAGKSLVQDQVESSDINDEQYLVTKCVVDDLLNN